MLRIPTLAGICLVAVALAAEGAALGAERALKIVDQDAPTGDRVALVVGNARYATAPLRNPVNDARAIAAKLRDLDFEVIEYYDLKQREIGVALRQFRSRIRPGATAVFFYAGHGLQIKGINYLPATDADIVTEDDVPTQSIDVARVLEVMEGAKSRVNLVYLDACRNNPYKRTFRSAPDGLARITPPSGTLIFYATRPGSVAADGTGDNGLYTQHLLAAMDQPGLTVEQVQKRVARGVERDSRGSQEPWMEGLLKGEFYFHPAARKPAENDSDQPGPVELAFWNAVQNSPFRGDFEDYLANYPNGYFASLARRRAQNLQAEKPGPSAALAAASGTAQFAPVPAAPAPPQAGPPASATAGPPAGAGRRPNPGEYWTYDVIENYAGNLVGKYRINVKSVSGDSVTEELDVNNGARVAIQQSAIGNTPDIHVFRMPHDTNYWITDFAPYLGVAAPLERGKSWKVELPMGDMSACRGDATVKGKESVKVPAGVFQATPVEVRCTFRKSPLAPPSRLQLIAWYAPEVGRVLRVDKLVSANPSDLLGDERESYQLRRFSLQ